MQGSTSTRGPVEGPEELKGRRMCVAFFLDNGVIGRGSLPGREKSVGKCQTANA